MKVNIVEQVIIEDEDRLRLGAVITGKLKPKHHATRDEVKKFCWEHGAGWDNALYVQYQEKFVAPQPDTADEDDLLGDEEDDLLGDDLSDLL